MTLVRGVYACSSHWILYQPLTLISNTGKWNWIESLSSSPSFTGTRIYIKLSDGYKNKTVEGLCGNYEGQFFDPSTKATIGQNPNPVQLAQIAEHFSAQPCQDPITTEWTPCQVNDIVTVILFEISFSWLTLTLTSIQLHDSIVMALP